MRGGKEGEVYLAQSGVSDIRHPTTTWISLFLLVQNVPSLNIFDLSRFNYIFGGVSGAQISSLFF